jgi:hypothetical protein
MGAAMTRLFASRLMSPGQAGLAGTLPDRKLVAASAFGALASFFAALVRALVRFFASAAASQEGIRRHEDELSRLPDDRFAARGPDRGEIRRAIEKGRMGL